MNYFSIFILLSIHNLLIFFSAYGYGATPPDEDPLTKYMKAEFTSFDKEEYVGIVLDASSGMGQMVDDTHSRADLAKHLAKQVIKHINIARSFLIVYGLSKTPGDCRDASEIVPIGSSMIEFEKALQNYKPLGNTPLAYALRLAQWNMEKLSGPRRILLIHASWDSCGHDPMEARRMIHNLGIRLQVMNLGYDQSSASLSSDTALYRQFRKPDDVEQLSFTASQPILPLNALVKTNPLVLTFEGVKGGTAISTQGDRLPIQEVKILRPKQIQTKNPLPIYPQTALRKGIHGKVNVALFVDASGHVQDVAVKTSSGNLLLDHAATSTLRHWIFQPARADLKLAAAVHVVTIHFSPQLGVIVAEVSAV